MNILVLASESGECVCAVYIIWELGIFQQTCAIVWEGLCTKTLVCEGLYTNRFNR